MISSTLDQFVNRLRRLYSPPAVAMQVVELAHQPAVDTKTLKECIENDPALTTRILRVVNNSLFGSSPRVTDLTQALALLGTQRLKLLALGFSLPKELLAGLEEGVLQRYWRRALIKAVAARELAETLWRMPGDDAFIAGLLQDMGMLVLMQDLGDAYLTFLERVYHDGGDLFALETATLGFDHATLSGRLLEQWGLPESIVRDVSRPFDPDTLVGLPERERDVPQILHMADLVAEFLTRERGGAMNELMDVGDRYRGVSIDELELLIASLQLKVPQLAELLSTSLPHETAFSTILSRAYLVAHSEACEFGELLQQTRTLHREIGQYAGPRSGNRAPNQPVRHVAAVVAHDGISSTNVSGTVTTLDVVPAPGLLESIEAAVKTCRQARHALSLALLELDHADPVGTRGGPPQIQNAMDRLQSLMKAIVDHDGRFMQVDGSRFAVVLEGFERQPAVELTRRLVHCTRVWSAEQAATQSCLPSRAVSLSAGVATLAMPPQNFPGQELIDAAERCLHGVQLSGGDSVKSIDI